MILESFPALRNLSAEEKEQLIFELCEDTAEREIEVDESTRRLLESRIAEYHANPDRTSTTADVTKRILALMAEISRRKSHG